MSAFIEHVLARVGLWHAGRVAERFENACRNRADAERVALTRALRTVRNSAYSREWRLDQVKSTAALRAAIPVQTYEDLRPTIDQVADGNQQALFAPDQRVLMFATSSGTTAQRKLIPVTPRFVEDYRRGWNTFGLRLLRDHPAAILRHILQVTGQAEEGRTAGGIPYGAITGLLARTQKRIVRRFYIGRPEIAALTDSAARYYTLMRLALERDVAFAITANPATLIRLAEVLNEQRETVVRDLHDGTLAPAIVEDAALCNRLAAPLRPAPQRARDLAALIEQHDRLRPQDLWNVTFLACWTGGSMGHYLERVRDWWGPVPVRDIGLLASEGRVSIPLDDGTPDGVLDLTSGFFEFIPLSEADKPAPQTLMAGELEVGGRYVVVMTNTAGLLRYRLDDVVEVTGWRHQAPLIRFLHRAGRVTSLAGEKLTEHQVVAATQAVCRVQSLPQFDFVAAPVWAAPPFYRLTVPHSVSGLDATRLDAELARHNEEYASRRKSGRLGPLVLRKVDPEKFAAFDRTLQAARGGTSEQYKRPCLLLEPGADETALPT
jgi:hypothetical protein